jgi:ParB family transcriptional regulator, chromosome partitioning protein
MELELQQLDLRYEPLRRRWPERERRLLASLAQNGQQTPIVVVKGCDPPVERYVVVDGFTRVRCLKKLKADTVLATLWQLSELDALILERLIRDSEGDDPFEYGWLLRELQLRSRPTPSQEELARRLARSPAWVSLRLGLVEELPQEIQECVRSGQIAPYAAMKYLVPFARANLAGCLRLVRALGSRAPSSRQLEALYRAWLAGDEPARERLLCDPWLFLKAQEELRREGPLEKPPARLLLSDLGAIAAISRRAAARLREGSARQLTGAERGEVTLCLAQSRADTQTVFHLLDKELVDARPGPAPSHP